MKRVDNRKCIRNLSVKSMRTAKLRNGIAVLAIALTAMLFTALFTIAGSLNESFQQQNFRQAGGDFHGVFKDVSEEQIEELAGGSLIKEWGVRTILGMPEDAPFQKAHVEVGYADETCAYSMFCRPVEGRLPEEGTNEAATDLRVLKLLGVEPRIGEEFTITYYLGQGTAHLTPVTATFVLSGWWEYDGVNIASHVLVPETYVTEVLSGYESQGESDMTGRWDMYVNFKNAYHIRENLNEVLEHFGYQGENESADNYVAIGVNWGYTGAQLSNSMDMGDAGRHWGGGAPDCVYGLSDYL